MSDQHFYENQSKKMGSRENIENLISNLKSTQKITKKTLDSPFRTSLSVGTNHIAAVHVTKYLSWFRLLAIQQCQSAEVCVIEHNLKTTSNRNVTMSIIPKKVKSQ